MVGIGLCFPGEGGGARIGFVAGDGAVRKIVGLRLSGCSIVVVAGSAGSELDLRYCLGDVGRSVLCKKSALRSGTVNIIGVPRRACGLHRVRCS